MREAVLETASSRRGEEPVGGAVGLPVFAQQHQGALGDRDDAIAAAFAADMEHLAFPIDVGGSELCSLAQPQAAGVDGDEADSIYGDADPGEDLMDFLPGQDHRKPGLTRWASDIEDTPLLLECLLVEELDAAERHGDGAALELPLVFEIEEVAAELLFIDEVGGSREVLRELADAGYVGFLGSFGVASKLEVVDHALA
jgi:hypothetical protein